mgnify:FL=1
MSGLTTHLEYLCEKVTHMSSLKSCKIKILTKGLHKDTPEECLRFKNESNQSKNKQEEEKKRNYQKVQEKQKQILT